MLCERIVTKSPGVCQQSGSIDHRAKTHHHAGGMDRQRRAAGAYRKTQGLIKSTDPPASEKAGPSGPTEPDSPIIPPGESLQAVAEFLTLIGRAQAAVVLQRMPRVESDRIIDTMSRVGPISPSRARAILAQFGARVRDVDHAVAGGPEVAREILVRALGPEEGEKRFFEILPEQRPHRFAFLDDADGRQLAALLRKESPATIAIIAANTREATAARLIEALPSEVRVDVVRRMATMEAVDAAVLAAVEDTLRRKMEAIERPDTEEVDGEARLAEILRYLDLQTSDAILEDLGSQQPDTAEQIRRRMTTLDDVVQLRDRDLQIVLGRVDDVDLAVLLKGKPPAVENRLLAAVSRRRAELVRMERESLGPMHRRDVDRVTAEFIEMVRAMARAGEIVISRDREEFV